MSEHPKDENQKELKARLDELEKTNFTLSKRVAELEGLLEEKEVDIRSMTKKLKNQDELESHYRGVLENFTKQAKEQYRKYENYLDNAEDLLDYALTYFNCLHEMVEGTLDAVLLEGKVELSGYFNYENKAAAENNVKTIVERFSKSQFLNKKKLFVDIKKRMNLKSVLKLSEMQDKFEKLLEEGPKQKQYAKSVSIGAEENMRDELFEASYYKLREHMERFREMLAEGLYPDFGAAAISELLGSINRLSDELYKYLDRFKKELGGESSSPETFNTDVEALRKQLDGLEKLEYGKLIELREKNNKLQIIQNHIKNLSKENEDLVAKITDNEFNLMVNNEIILAYEKSIKEKEEALKQKQEELERVKLTSDELNQRIAKLTLELIGMLIRCRQ